MRLISWTLQSGSEQLWSFSFLRKSTIQTLKIFPSNFYLSQFGKVNYPNCKYILHLFLLLLVRKKTIIIFRLEMTRNKNDTSSKIQKSTICL
jgi:hypothetical protein